MVLINHLGRVAEGTGSCLVMVRDGKIATPTTTEGALESITLDITEALAKSAGVPFERRPIDRTELYVADEIALCGTLAELVPIKSIDGYALQRTAILPKLQVRFFRAVRAIEPHEAVELMAIATNRSIAKRPMRSNTPPSCRSWRIGFLRAVRAIEPHEVAELTARIRDQPVDCERPLSRQGQSWSNAHATDAQQLVRLAGRQMAA